jgi:hypothetical protein
VLFVLSGVFWGVGGPSWAEWSVAFTPGNLTVVGLDHQGNVAASDWSVTSGPAVAIVLSLDCPNPLTGTGSKLLLDGQDVALVRATLVDSAGNQAMAFVDPGRKNKPLGE